ncbi:MAG: polymer-forming cytoskeletal protein [Patescibacteria group bacterium]|jgi:cytoskeletal protein CcmA (bactofilin family)|nr:polymer-forming cytoskeletal protein [Patescibacteria group bacterium]MDD3435140.1 polymer-forming cytoskeletal protein [Patescibacteria group bacterium]MDD4466404.1 polymer-forming cytoskeletal protein [Patescibacteria group bacterium]NCU39770.1 polymer-forming cytoskeletal protein [Candidatus Falkowbacteria bacterium]
MFNKEMKPEKFKDAETIIGSSVTVKGDFHGTGNIIIEGSLEGSLKTDADVYIGEKAQVVANIEAENATINGQINGTIKISQYLALGSTAKINGDVNFQELSVSRGALINGRLSSHGAARNKKNNSTDKKEVLPEEE